ncbi:MAG: hypothetical protein P4L46_15875 [Fimbriimonas sp.]|nr:hypothetical protein [Fimbriimonas sp.]
MPDFRQPSFHGLIGFAREEITPPIGIYARNWGASEHDIVDDVHRPLTATAMTLRTTQDASPLVLVSLDLGWWRRKEDEWLIRGHLIEQFNLDSARVIIALTNTHSGPSTCLEDAEKPGGNLIRPYLNLVRDNVSRVVREAFRSAKPATLAWSYGRCRLAKNRDQWVPDRNCFISGFDERAPADPVLLVGLAVADDGHTMGTVVNYACAPTSLGWQNRVISPDYIGSMRELVENETHSLCLFVQGAAGEMAPRDQYASDPEVADRNGRELGYAVLSTLQSMMPPGFKLHHGQTIRSDAELAIWDYVEDTAPKNLEATIHTVEVPLKPMPSLAEVEEQMALSEDRMMVERLRRERHVLKTVGSEETVRVPIWLWSVGDTLVIGCPGTPYSLLQRHLRLHFVEKAVVAIGVANGWYGFLPPRELYDKEVYTVHETPFAKGSLEFMIHGSISQFERLCKLNPPVYA